ncbi:MAG: hypothetical protein V1862_02845 [Methanobacteriota archaeon]
MMRESHASLSDRYGTIDQAKWDYLDGNLYGDPGCCRGNVPAHEHSTKCISAADTVSYDEAMEGGSQGVFFTIIAPGTRPISLPHDTR